MDAATALAANEAANEDTDHVSVSEAGSSVTVARDARVECSVDEEGIEVD